MTDDVRVRYAWTQDARSSMGYLFVLAVGIMLSWIVCSVLGAMAITAIYSRLKTEPTISMAGVYIAIGAIGAAVFVWGISPDFPNEVFVMA